MPCPSWVLVVFLVFKCRKLFRLSADKDICDIKCLWWWRETRLLGCSEAGWIQFDQGEITPSPSAGFILRILRPSCDDISTSGSPVVNGGMCVWISLAEI